MVLVGLNAKERVSGLTAVKSTVLAVAFVNAAPVTALDEMVVVNLLKLLDCTPEIWTTHMPFKLLPVGAGIVMLLRATVPPEDPDEDTDPHAVEYVKVAPEDKLKLLGNA